MISLIVMTQPKGIPARPEGQNIVGYFDPPPSRYFYPPSKIDDKVLFAFYI